MEKSCEVTFWFFPFLLNFFLKKKKRFMVIYAKTFRRFLRKARQKLMASAEYQKKLKEAEQRREQERLAEIRRQEELARMKREKKEARSMNILIFFLKRKQ